MGTSIAFHLSVVAAKKRKKKGGVKSVLLLEQSTLTSGSTWHAAGLVSHFKGGSGPMTEMVKYSAELYSSMRDEATGLSLVGWHNNGSIGLARTKEHRDSLLHGIQVCREHGIDVHLHEGAAELRALRDEHHPLLDITGVVAAMSVPADGIVNPADVTQQLASMARANGVEIIQGVSVADLEEAASLGGDGERSVSALRTTCGQRIECDAVVLACGQWTRQLAQSCDVDLAQACVPHQYIVFDAVAGSNNSLPTIRDFQYRYYLKPEVGGFILGEFEESPLLHMPASVLARNREGGGFPLEGAASFELYDEDFVKSDAALSAAMRLVPSLSTAGVKQVVHGPDAHAADHNPLMGRSPRHTNLFVCSAFNSQGIQTGAGAGLAMAEWVTDGYPSSFESDFWSLDLRRFAPQQASDATWCLKRAAQCYDDTYSTHHPLAEVTVTRDPHDSDENQKPLDKRSALHGELAGRGAVFGQAFSWERPLWFIPSGNRQDADHATRVAEAAVVGAAGGGHSFNLADCAWHDAVRTESLACRERACLFDMSSFGKIIVSGPGAARALNYLCAGDVASARRPPGSVVYTQMLNRSGGIESDLTVCRLAEDRFYVVTGAGVVGRDMQHFHHELRAAALEDGVTLHDATERMSVLAVMGPLSRTILERALGASEVSLSNDDFAFGTMQSLPWFVDTADTTDSFALRVSYVGELGWEIHCDYKNAPRIFKSLVRAGRDVTEDLGLDQPALSLGGYRSIMTCLRLEKRYVHWGHDVTPLDTPLEAGLRFAVRADTVHDDGADFIGRAAIEAALSDERGVSRRLVSLFVPPPAVGGVSLWGHEGIIRDGERVGFLTSAGFSFTCDCPLGLGYIHAPSGIACDADFLKSGSYELELGDGPATRIPCEVRLQALVDPKGKRLRGDTCR